MNKSSILLWLILACTVYVQPLQAQVYDAWLERGQNAFEEQRYDDAASAYRRIIEREPKHAEARYLLARVLFVKGEKKSADRSIERALQLEPENVAFLELKLEIGFPRIPLEIVRKPLRDELAEKILQMDSLSVPANIQLGQSNMEYWLKGRGRITISRLAPIAAGDLGSTRPQMANIDWRSIDQMTRGPSFVNSASLSHTFDVDRQTVLGHEVLDMSGHAEQAYPKAVAYLSRALMRDQTNQAAYLNLARLYLTRLDMSALTRMAESMQKFAPEDYYTWLLGGYSHHQLAHEAEAALFFSEAFRLMPDSISIVYEDTERLMNKAGRSKKKKDADYSDEAFWDFRDPRFLTPENERLSEHYARILYADLLFSEPKLNLNGWNSERGEVYIRYGAPQAEYYLSNAVAQCKAATYENFHIFEYPTAKFVFGSLWPHLNEYVFYSPCSQIFHSRGAVGAKIDYEIIARENIRELPEAFYYDASGKRVDFPYMVNRFKGDQGSVDLVVPYGIPVQFNAMQLTHTLGLDAGAFLLSEKGGIQAERRHSVQNIRVKNITRFEDAALWLDAHQLNIAPGSYDLSIEFETATGAGAGFYRSPIEAPNFNDEDLQVSDIMLAYAIEEATPDDAGQPPVGTLFRAGLIIKPAPWGVFSKTQPMYLYFEMYNLKKNAENRSRYEVEAVLIEYRDEKGFAKLLKRAFNGKEKEGVSVRFENTSTGTDEGQYLILETTDQPPGQYVIVMRVRDLESNKTVESRRMVMLE